MRSHQISLAIVVVLLFACELVQSQGVTQSRTRAEFASAMAKMEEGMTEKEVLNLLGKPDDVFTESDPGGIHRVNTDKIWCYGAESHLSFPTLGCVYIDKNGRAQGSYGGRGQPPSPELFTEDELRTLLKLLDTAPDMTVEAFGKRTKDDPKRLTTYEEGPWLYKRNGLYYLFFAAGPISEHLGYSTSASPQGPWKYGGIVMPTQGGSFTDHPGVVDYKGNTYLFYHNAALPGGGGFHRSVCIEELKFNPNGTVPAIDMTKTGVAPVGKLNPFKRTEAETIAWESGVEIATGADRAVYVTGIHDGSYIRVCNVDFTDKGAAKFIASVAGAAEGVSLELRLDDPSGTLVGTLPLKPTSGPEKWVTQSCNVSGAKGVHDLILKFTGGKESSLNFDWWQFE